MVLCIHFNPSNFFIFLNEVYLFVYTNFSIIVGILPMILDIIMDSQVLVSLKNNTVNCTQATETTYFRSTVYQSKLPDLWGDRCMIVAILIVPSLTFLIFRESHFMPLLYIVQFLSQNILYPAVMLHSGKLLTIVLSVYICYGIL